MKGRLENAAKVEGSGEKRWRGTGRGDGFLNSRKKPAVEDQWKLREMNLSGSVDFSEARRVSSPTGNSLLISNH